MNVDPRPAATNDDPDPDVEAKPVPNHEDQSDPPRDEPPDFGPETALQW